MSGRSSTPHVLLALRDLERSATTPGIECLELSEIRGKARVLRLDLLRRATHGRTLGQAAAALGVPGRTLSRWLADSPECDSRAQYDINVRPATDASKPTE